MSDRRENIPPHTDPEALLLSGDWDALAPADQLSLKGMGIGQEEFHIMRTVLLEATGGEDSALSVSAPEGLKAALLDQFDRAHSGGSPRGRVVPLRRRTLMLTGVAASLAFLLIAAGALLITRLWDGDMPATPDRLAQHTTERDAEELDAEGSDADEPNAVEPDAVEPEQPKPEQTDPEQLHNHQTADNSRHPTVAATSGMAVLPSRKTEETTQQDYPDRNDKLTLVAMADTTEIAMSSSEEDSRGQFARTAAVSDSQPAMEAVGKSVSGIRTETPAVVHPKPTGTFNPSRPVSQDAQLLRLLYACR
jgi:hypothetical protein